MSMTYIVNAMPDLIRIGAETENGVEQIAFDAADWLAAWPDMRLSVWAQEPKTDVMYEAQTHRDGAMIVWDVGAQDTRVSGYGAVLVMGETENGERKLSARARTYIRQSGMQATADAPLAQQPWYTGAMEAARQAGADAGRAEEAAARAEAAEEAVYAPSASATRVEGGVLVTVTDKTGTTSAVIRDGERGETGPQGEPGPQGERGETGPQGPAGADGRDGSDAPQIDDAAVSDANPWSSRRIIDVLCPPVSETGNPVQCYPVPGYPLGVSVIWEPMQEGEGDPSPENIRPIVGRESVRVVRAGYQMIKSIEEVSNDRMSAVANEDRTAFTLTNLKEDLYCMAKFVTEADMLIAGNAYTIRAQIVGVGSINYRLYVGRSVIYQGNLKAGNEVQTFTAKQDAKLELYFCATSNVSYPAGMKTVISNVMLEKEGTAHEAYELSLPRTIYGGYVDAASGDGVETWGIIDAYEGEALPGAWISDRDVYTAGGTPTMGAQVAYKLAEPVHFAATGGETILAISGQNTIYTDADTLSVTAREDMQHRLETITNAIVSLGGNV